MHRRKQGLKEPDGPDAAMTPRPRIGVALLFILLGSSSCVTIYQPLSGLQTPIVVDPGVENFPDLSLALHCVPKDFLGPSEARALCRRVEQLFVTQGAQVEIVDIKEQNETADVSADNSESNTPRPNRLTLELRARQLNKSSSLLMWTLSIFTLTLAPAMSEYSFVQEISIRNDEGALLATGALKGRIVRFFGLGYWAGNGLANWLFRDDDEDLNDRRFRKSLSDDLYGQLSQMVFNAKQRQRVLASPGVYTSTTTKGGG